MARTESNMFPLGTRAPDFRLPDTVTDETVALNDIAGRQATLVMFICNHCPFVKHVIDGIVALANDYRERQVGIVAISANDVVNFPDDAPDKMKALAFEKRFPFPYLYDESQDVARAYQAACTPDFYLFDGELACVYRGRMDGATPGNDVPVTGRDLRDALEDVLAGRPVTLNQMPSVGCNIKWR